MSRPFTLKSVFRKSTTAHILSVGAPLCADRPVNGRLPPSWTMTCHDLSTIDYVHLPIQMTLRTVVAPFNSSRLILHRYYHSCTNVPIVNISGNWYEVSFARGALCRFSQGASAETRSGAARSPRASVSAACGTPRAALRKAVAVVPRRRSGRLVPLRRSRSACGRPARSSCAAR